MLPTLLKSIANASGVVHSVDAIVTRDASGFVGSEIPVVLPEELDTVNNDE